MDNRYLLSLCIPTNGMTEWVLPVLDSIYSGDTDENKFEVVIEDNGESVEFRNAIKEYSTSHTNIKYYRSKAQGFLCQIDSFKHAQGDFIKFVNHRSRLIDGTLDYLIECSEKYKDERPVIFFSNGNAKDAECVTFDDFVRDLGYYSSWSGGLAFWREDIELITSINEYNTLFPHTDMLFARRDSKKYYILNKRLFSDIDAGHARKGMYNLFKAFGSDYLSIIQSLYNSGDITIDTFLHVKKSLSGFLANLYIEFIIRKQPSSYSFDNYKKNLRVYYSRTEFVLRVAEGMVKKTGGGLLRAMGIYKKKQE